MLQSCSNHFWVPLGKSASFRLLLYALQNYSCYPIFLFGFTCCLPLFSSQGTSSSPKEKMVGSNGFEPSTSRLSGVRSNHLSYEPMFVFACGDVQNRVCPPCGGDEQNRTVDPLLARQVLSQLSYTPVYRRSSVRPPESPSDPSIRRDPQN